MPVTVACACGKSFPMPEFMAGQKANFRGCGVEVSIPQPGAAAASVPPPAEPIVRSDLP